MTHHPTSSETFPEPTLPSCPIIKLLRGQSSIVTGASSGIGKAIAISLGHAGANVVVNYVSGPDDAEAVAAEIRRSSASRPSTKSSPGRAT